MKKTLFAILIMACIPIIGFSQSKVMEKLSNTYDDATVLVFYYSTLKMLIPEESTELRELIYNIEKIKVLMIDDLFDGKQEIDQIKEDLNNDGYEEAISIRHEENNIIVYIREKRGKTSGFFFLMEEDNGITALDLVGEIAIDKLGLLTDQLSVLTNARNFSFN